MTSAPSAHVVVGSLLSLVLAGLAIFFFLPQEYGGQVTYLITSGISMEPAYHTGDLVLLRRADAYQVGDAVGVRDPKIQKVFHRLVGWDGARFTTKGDNNRYIDAYQPEPSAILGKLWLHIPLVGKVMMLIRTPFGVVMALGGVAFLMMKPASSEERRPRRFGRRPAQAKKPAAPGGGGSFTLVGANGEAAITLLGALALVLALLTLLAFTRPTKVSAPAPIIYQQTGVFSYAANASGGVYDSDTVPSGQPIYLAVAKQVAVTFTYRLVSPASAQAGGTYRVDLQLSRADGWLRTIELQPAKEFRGNTFSTSVPLDLGQVRDFMAAFGKTTGAGDSGYSLAVVPAVDVRGVLAGQQFQNHFEPKLAFTLDPVELQLAHGASAGPGVAPGDPLKPSQSGNIPGRRLVPNRLPLVKLSVASARWLSLVGWAFLLIAALPLVSAVLRGQGVAEPARIQAKYPQLIVSVGHDTLGGGRRIVEVTNIDDLAKLAERLGSLILHEDRGALHNYYVQDTTVTYRYQSGLDEHDLTEPRREARL